VAGPTSFTRGVGGGGAGGRGIPPDADRDTVRRRARPPAPECVADSCAGEIGHRLVTHGGSPSGPLVRAAPKPQSTTSVSARTHQHDVAGLHDPGGYTPRLCAVRDGLADPTRKPPPAARGTPACATCVWDTAVWRVEALALDGEAHAVCVALATRGAVAAAVEPAEAPGCSRGRVISASRKEKGRRLSAVVRRENVILQLLQRDPRRLEFVTTEEVETWPSETRE